MIRSKLEDIRGLASEIWVECRQNMWVTLGGMNEHEVRSILERNENLRYISSVIERVRLQMVQVLSLTK